MPGRTSAAAADGAPVDAWIGRTVAGRFAILKRLGEGGVGRVYVAEQTIGKAKRRVALKMLLPEHASNPEMIERFSRECETVSVIEHTNVVRLYDFGQAEDGALYVAMELVPGCSLGALIAEEGALEPRRALDLFAQICRGVSAAHDREIIHRDLKPDNLMVVQKDDEPERVVVLDFGIAKTVGAAAIGTRPLTRLGIVIGSPAYMSPEQFVGGEIDVRTDVYALGVVAYEMLTGVLPFDADDVNGWAAQHIVAAPRSFDATEAGRRVPAPVRRVIERAMAKNPADRPSTVRVLRRELTEAFASTPARTVIDVAANAPIASPAIAPLPQPRRRPRRSRVATVGRWALVAVTATGAGSLAALAAASSPTVASHASAPSPPPTPASVPADDVAPSAPPVIHPVPPLSPVAPPKAAAAPKRTAHGRTATASRAGPVASPPAAKPDLSGCERAVNAATCEDARAGQRTCPDTAGSIHHRANEHADELCGASEHHPGDPLPPLPTATPLSIPGLPQLGTITVVTSSS